MALLLWPFLMCNKLGSHISHPQLTADSVDDPLELCRCIFSKGRGHGSADLTHRDVTPQLLRQGRQEVITGKGPVNNGKKEPSSSGSELSSAPTCTAT